VRLDGGRRGGDRAEARAHEPHGLAEILAQLLGDASQVGDMVGARAESGIEIRAIARLADDGDVVARGGEEIAAAHQEILRSRDAVLHADAALAAREQHHGGRRIGALHPPVGDAHARACFDGDKAIRRCDRE
jgi:hypothetical protein